MVKEIQLTQGKVALVDDEDFEELNKYKWCAHKPGTASTYYAMRAISVIINGKRKQKMIDMHRQILGFPKGMIDHINRNGLDNRKKNLRICTRSTNRLNSKIRKDNKSGFRGVCWYKQTKKWVAHIAQPRITIGYFDDVIEAAKAYDKKAIELYGDFAQLNFNKTT